MNKNEKFIFPVHGIIKLNYYVTFSLLYTWVRGHREIRQFTFRTSQREIDKSLWPLYLRYALIDYATEVFRIGFMVLNMKHSWM